MYLLFAGEWYYPEGGMSDLVGSFPSMYQAMTWGEIFMLEKGYCSPDWAHIAKGGDVVAVWSVDGWKTEPPELSSCVKRLREKLPPKESVTDQS